MGLTYVDFKFCVVEGVFGVVRAVWVLYVEEDGEVFEGFVFWGDPYHIFT